MTELYIDGYRIDIEEGQIRQTFQNNTLGSVADRQLSYTNSFKALNTGKNQRFFGHLQEINNQSDKPYRYLPAKIVEDGLEVNSGTAIIRKSNDKFVEIYMYSGNNGLYEAINNKTLRDLDWTDLNHTISEAIVLATFDSSQPYYYAIADYTDLTNRQAYLEYWLPSVFEHWIWDKIFEEAGFEYEGDIFATDEFKRPLVNPVTFDENETDLLVRDFSKMMPDILQTEFIREILVRYGLMFEKTRNQNKYTFKQLKDIFRDRGNAVDWSDKVTEIKDITYKLGDYGIRNYFRYLDIEGYSKNADGFFELDVENLPQQKTVHQSIYSVNQRVTVFDTLKFPIFQFDDEGNVEITEIDPSISTVVKESSSFQFQSAGGFGSNFTGDVPYLRFQDLDYPTFVLDNYFELKQIANRAKVVDAEIFIDAVDVYNLNFFNLVFIKQLSSFFYLNKIDNFRNGKTCGADLVRIPPNVFSGQEASNTAPVVQLFANPNPVNEETNITFTHLITDAENNVEKWELTFGNGQKQSGFGLPPTSIVYQYANPGNYTATLTVTDFEGLMGTSSVNIVVNDTFVVTFNSVTGEYNAPPGSTVTVSGQIGGAGDADGLFAAGSSPTATIGQSGWSTYGSRQLSLRITGSIYPTSDQFVFVMPSSGTVWFKGILNVGPSGPAPNYLSVSISNNGETKGYAMNSTTRPVFP